MSCAVAVIQTAARTLVGGEGATGQRGRGGERRDTEKTNAIVMSKDSQ